WGMLGYSLGSVGLLAFAPLAQRIKMTMPNGYTSGDFFRLRFGKLAWRIFLAISLFYSLGWLVSLGMAAGVLLESLSGIPYTIGLSVIMAVCVAYTMLGGLKAVIGTDFIQTIIILIGVAVLGWQVIDSPGLENIYTKIEEYHPALLDLGMPAGLMFLFNNLFFGVGEIFHSNVWWSRSFAFREGTGFRSFLYAGLFWIPVPVATGFLAFAVFALNIPVPAADAVGPLVASFILGKYGAILIFVIVFSSLASSLDSLLAATSDLILEDIYHRHFAPKASKQQMRKMAVVIILLLGISAWLICLPRIANLAQLLHFTGALVASTIWPVVFGLYYPSINGRASSLAMAGGCISGLTAYFAVGFYTAALVSAFVSFVICAGFMLASKTRFDFQKLQEESNDAASNSF
ncbi:MAG: urea transporter, partial [Leptospiraceae bacterium]|nr:urea transporter [Leptospiraceae bacterium]